MKDNSFEPQGIKVKPGTTVTWVNRDSAVHNVRQVESAFLSPDVNPAGEFTFTFDGPGRYRYQCTHHHPIMNGVVFVAEGCEEPWSNTQGVPLSAAHIGRVYSE